MSLEAGVAFRGIVTHFDNDDDVPSISISLLRLPEHGLSNALSINQAQSSFQNRDCVLS